MHPQTLTRISQYLEVAKHGTLPEAPLFIAAHSGYSDRMQQLTGNSIYRRVVKKYASIVGLKTGDISVHGLRATAATNALQNGEDIARVQEWLGHANIATTQLL